MDWVPGFYSTTGRWWGGAESAITERDHRRAATIARLARPAPADLLELGCAYANSAAAAADAGYRVVGVEVSDRLGFADRHRAGRSVELVRGDFYRVDLGRAFDVVYWNGFGVGSDADQRRLLRRIADEWLRPDGVALIDVASPFCWARWAHEGRAQAYDPDPARGYHHRGTRQTGRVARGGRRPGPLRLAAFDLDGTLLRGDTVCVALARRLGRLAEMEAFERLTDQDAIGAARAEMARWYAPCAGETLRAHLGDLRLAPGAEEAFRRLRQRGVTTAIVSITWEFAVAHVAALVGADHFVGTGLDDRGDVAHFWPEDKARWLRELAAGRGVPMDEIAAVGDSWGDVPMLRAVGRPYFVGASLPPGLEHAVHVPDGDVRRIAEHILAT